MEDFKVVSKALRYGEIINYDKDLGGIWHMSFMSPNGENIFFLEIKHRVKTKRRDDEWKDAVIKLEESWNNYLKATSKVQMLELEMEL